MACLIFSVSIYNLNINKEKIRFSNIFGKKVDATINDISKWGINEFSLSLVDPLKMNRFSKIRFKNKDGFDNTIIVLNPTVMSKHHDIGELLNLIRTKHDSEKNITNIL